VPHAENDEVRREVRRNNLPPFFWLNNLISFQSTERRRYIGKENSSGQYQLARAQSILLRRLEIYPTGTCSSESTRMQRNGRRCGICPQRRRHLSLFGKPLYRYRTFATLVVIHTYCQSMLTNHHGYWQEVLHIHKYDPGD
jgi:hypothetical protein